MAEDNSNTSTNTANADYSGEDNDGGDIEQGRIGISGNSGSRSSSSSWAVDAAITGSTSTPTTSTATRTWTLGGLENVDVEDAAPIPLIQQIADMEELEKKDNVEPIEDASTTPQPPQQEAMLEQIEDDDDAAPRPFTDFERESRVKIELEDIPTDEDDGPPLPLSYQRDSLSCAEGKNVAATSQISASNSPNEESAAAASASVDINDNESIGGDAVVQQIDEGESPRDEENLQQRYDGSNDYPASEDENLHQVVKTAETNSVPILEAYLVEEEEGGDDTQSS
eukprot:scaffold5398_cov70-Skeletonema_marinoi.AAC.10